MATITLTKNKSAELSHANACIGAKAKEEEEGRSNACISFILSTRPSGTTESHSTQELINYYVLMLITTVLMIIFC